MRQAENEIKYLTKAIVIISIYYINFDVAKATLHNSSAMATLVLLYLVLL